MSEYTWYRYWYRSHADTDISISCGIGMDNGYFSSIGISVSHQPSIGIGTGMNFQSDISICIGMNFLFCIRYQYRYWYGGFGGTL